VTPRIVHIVSSLVIVVVAYWTYALLAVPLIEPAADPHQQAVAGTELPPSPPPAITKDLERLFPPGSWELQDPKVLASDQAILLLQKYESLGDGWVDLFPLTMLVLPNDPNVEFSERIQHAVVMEVPEGAKVRFDEPFSPSRLRMGRIKQGTLRGQVTVRSRGKRPDHADDLHVVTRNVQLSEERIWTSEQVDFRLGPHYGRGREMEIRLLPREGAGKGRSGPNVGGIEQFEVQHLERLHLDMAAATPKEKPGPQGPPRAAAALPGAGRPGGSANRAAPPGARGTAAPLGAAGAWPIEITCRGPFRFHMVQQVATFRDQVDMLRIRPSGPSDRLSCELLSVYFVQAAKVPGPAGDQAEAAKASPSSFDLQPRRMVAQGQPATVTALADNLFARGERLDYDFQSGTIIVEHAQEAVLQQGPNEIHAPKLRYEPAAEPGRLGQVWAKGPGWFRGLLTEQADRASSAPAAARPGQQTEAHWLEQLEIKPQGQNQLVSLTGGASVKSETTGKLDAHEIYFWLNELPQPVAPGQNRLQPDRMLAQGDVKIDSPQLSGAMERLAIWFTPAAAAAAKPVGAGVPGVSPLAPPGGPRTAAPPAPSGQFPGAPPAQPQHMDLQGREVQARMLLGERQQAVLMAVTVDGDVRCVQTQTAQPGDQPMLVTGQRLEVTDANTAAIATVTGSPAHFEARGLSLTGSNIHFHRGDNRVWVLGAGWMLAPMKQDLDGKLLPEPVPLRVDWRRRMDFDGKVARFEEQVTAASPSQTLRTQQMDVHFLHPVVFTDPNPKEQPQIEQLFCRGGVLMENRSADEAGRPLAYDRMAVADLAANLINGALTASGPGWAISVRRGSADPFHAPPPAGARPAAAAPGAAPAAPPAAPRTLLAGNAHANPAQLTCTHVRFLGSITGNLHSKVMTFHEQVRAAHAPVQDQNWLATLESDDPDVLGPGAAVLHCDHLTLSDMGAAAEGVRPAAPKPAGGLPGSGHADLLAVGNVVAEGSTFSSKGTLRYFTARATRMSYSQIKDLAVLEGDGRTDAQLFLEERQGGTPTRFAGQKILYWRGEDRATIEGWKSMDLPRMPGGEQKPRAKPPPSSALRP
jgi:hypothetical protein